MKKTLLTFMLSLALGGASVCAQSSALRLAKAPDAVAPAPAAAQNGCELKFCGDIYTWMRMSSSSNMTYTHYIYITPDIATQLAGNKLKDITFSSVIQSSAAGLQGSVFVYEDLEADPVTSTQTIIKNSYNNGKGAFQTVALEEPYEIKEGTGFYFGYEVVKCNNNDYPTCIGSIPANEFSGSVKVSNSFTGRVIETVDVGASTGANLVLFATTVGDKTAINDIFSSGNISFGNFTLPVFEVSEAPVINLPIYNLGDNTLTSLKYSLSINGEESEPKEITVAVSGHSIEYVPIELSDVTTGYNDVKLTVLAINDIEAVKETSAAFLGINGGYPRKFVVEEGTGTWCGWCPRGIVGMEKMSAKYPDTFIGIAVHSGDTFEVNSYTALISKFFDGFPSCIINRDPIYNTDPSYDEFEACYDIWSSQLAIAKIGLEVTKINDSGTRIRVNTNTEFCLSMDNAKMAYAFVVIEDGLEGVQSNYYSGRTGELEGWDNKGSSVKWTYLDTARGIYNCWGLKNSVPTSIVEGESYEYEYSLILSNVKDPSQTSVIALLLDTNSGTILNAEKVKAADYKVNSGIADVIEDHDAPVEYYNLQGVRMDGNSLPTGLYIVRQGDKVTKSIIR